MGTNCQLSVSECGASRSIREGSLRNIPDENIRTEERQAVFELFLKKIRKALEEKKGFVFSGQLYILRRK